MHQMRISTTQVSSVMLRSKKLEIRKKKEVKTVKEPSDENQTECHETETKLLSLNRENIFVSFT
jgi:hypothetical protein